MQERALAIISVGTPMLWVGFTLFVIVMLALDLGVFHRKSHVIAVPEALRWTAFWIGLALAFNVGVYFWFGPTQGMEFLAGYVLEKALSVDNLFVILMLFNYFAVPALHQHRVLFWGILGALIMRAIFILAGAALIQQFSWVIYVFGVFLIYTGFKLLWTDDEEADPETNPVLKLMRRFLPMVNEYRGSSFVVRENGKLFATPLLTVLVLVEATDIVFAVDSIPAVFGVTQDPFIVYTSNIFAILGLRSLYFALAGLLGMFHHLKIGLGLVLAFVGAKMLISGYYHVPVTVSLGVIAVLLGGSIAASLLFPPKEGHDPS